MVFAFKIENYLKIFNFPVGVIPSICDHFGQCSQRCVRKNSFISCECSLGYVREFGRWGQCKAKGTHVYIWPSNSLVSLFSLIIYFLGWKEAKIIILDSQMLHMASHFHNLSNVQLKTEESESYLSDFDYYFENNDGNILSRKIVYVWADAVCFIFLFYSRVLNLYLFVFLGQHSDPERSLEKPEWYSLPHLHFSSC